MFPWQIIIYRTTFSCTRKPGTTDEKGERFLRVYRYRTYREKKKERSGGIFIMHASPSHGISSLCGLLPTKRKNALYISLNTRFSSFQDPREALIVSLKREVNILQQENNHLRQLLELADSDSGISSFPQENSASLLAQMGMDRGGANQPLDGRGADYILSCVLLEKK